MDKNYIKEQNFVTEYTKYCTLCGTPTTEIHHLCYGGANRRLSDEDNLVIPICRECHNDIHNIPTAGKLSKIVGQLAYELNENAHKGDILNAREKFRKRYGKSYL
jgi:hypothetical protein